MWALGNRSVSFEQWAPMVGGIAGLLSLFTVLIFKLFPSTEGSGQRLLGWLCTYGPLWPVNRVLRARTLDHLLSPQHLSGDLGATKERLNAALELFALLAPVMQRHPKWFTQGYIDAEGVKHLYRHRFVESRIKWCLFWRGEPYAKFQARLK